LLAREAASRASRGSNARSWDRARAVGGVSGPLVGRNGTALRRCRALPWRCQPTTPAGVRSTAHRGGIPTPHPTPLQRRRVCMRGYPYPGPSDHARDRASPKGGMRGCAVPRAVLQRGAHPRTQPRMRARARSQTMRNRATGTLTVSAVPRPGSLPGGRTPPLSCGVRGCAVRLDTP